MGTSQTTPALFREAWGGWEPRIAEAPCADDALAAVSGDDLCERFEESLVAARVFLTVPKEALPRRQWSFAASFARSVKLAPPRPEDAAPKGARLPGACSPIAGDP